jgi:lysyl-tRNA synthetase class 2
MSTGDLRLLRGRPSARYDGRRAAGLPATGLKLAALPLAAVVFVTAAFGWLYWVRAGVAAWPGPKMAALPLDELATHDTVPVAMLFVAILGAATFCGLVARATGLGRLVSAGVLGVSAGMWSYVHVAASYYVVYQIPVSDAMRRAASAPVIYLVASIVALAGALLARPHRTGPSLTALAAIGVALAGLVDLVAAFTPTRPNGLISVAPSVLLPLGRAIDLPVGLLLIVSSRGLARRSLAAWQIAVGALVLSSIAHLALFPTRPLPAVLMVALGVVLVARRARYAARHDPAGIGSAALRMGVVVALTGAVAALGIVVEQEAAGDSSGFGRALVQGLRALGGQRIGTRHMHDFALWFPWSISACLALGVLWAVVPWVAPWRPRFYRAAHESRHARRLVRTEGHDSLAPFALRADKSLFFFPPGPPEQARAVIAYRVVRGVALASGAPVGDAEARRPAIEAFCDWAHRRGWMVGVLGVSVDDLALYESLGLAGVYHGDEAFIDVDRFSLNGGPMKAVRQAVNRVERLGYQSAVVRAGDVPPMLRREMLAVERAWIADAPRKGFAMELDDLFRLGGDDAFFVLGTGPDGRLAGFLHLVACPASHTMSLSSMPRLAELPNGFTSWLIVRGVEWCALHGVEQLSLNFSPLAGLFDAQATRSAWKRTQQRAAMRVKAALSLQLDNLQLFNRQFCPDFRPRYVVVERWTDLPRVVVAAMAAEGYLPFAERLRGWPAPLGRDGAEPGFVPGATLVSASGAGAGAPAAGRGRPGPPGTGAAGAPGSPPER